MSAAPKISTEDILSRTDELPTLPIIVQELTQVINDPMSSTGEVEKLMQKDQSLTTQVLKLANSSYYAIPGGVSTLGRAIAYLGYDTVHQLAISTSIFKVLGTKETDGFSVRQFWMHSFGVAIAAEVIGKQIRHGSPADLFTCGLVHDMGKIAYLQLSPEGFQQVVDLAKKKSISFYDAEAELEAPRHTLIGARIANKWRLPSHIQAAIKQHHQRDPAHRGLSADLNRTVDVVYLANVLIHAMKFGNSGHTKETGAPVDVMNRLSLDPKSDFKRVLHEIKENLDRASDFLKVLEDQK